MTKILLVDDSKFLGLATERALAQAEYAVNTASDGEQALQMARERAGCDPTRYAAAQNDGAGCAEGVEERSVH